MMKRSWNKCFYIPSWLIVLSCAGRLSFLFCSSALCCFALCCLDGLFIIPIHPPHASFNILISSFLPTVVWVSSYVDLRKKSWICWKVSSHCPFSNSLSKHAFLIFIPIQSLLNHTIDTNIISPSYQYDHLPVTPSIHPSIHHPL